MQGNEGRGETVSPTSLNLAVYFFLGKMFVKTLSVLFHFFTAELRQRISPGPFQEGHGQAIYLGEDGKTTIF